MDKTTASIILNNLRDRIEKVSEGKYRLDGIITQKELDALEALISGTDFVASPQPVDPAPRPAPQPPIETAPTETPEIQQEPKSVEEPEIRPQARDEIVPDLSTLQLPESDSSYRVCMDFGTAMSKASFVHDNEDEDMEEIQVLKLGIPGDQEEIDEVMLVSSVFIDADGLLWFGQNAVKHNVEGTGLRIDNVKRALSEEILSAPVEPSYNPTKQTLTYKDIVLAYLTFFTWAINYALANDVETPSVARNFKRRFGMPCFDKPSTALAIESELKKLLGEAQVLSDTFGDQIHHGLPLDNFLSAIKQLRTEKRTYSFIECSVTEPLGVAGSLLSWQTNHDSLTLVVDIGAGTSDFSLYRLKVAINDDGTIHNSTREVEKSARGITKAGNYLDMLLKGFILKKAKIESSNEEFQKISHDLERNKRDFKETLFNTGSVFVPLINGQTVEFSLNEFLSLNEVNSFENLLRETMVEILESTDPDLMNWVQSDAHRKLNIVLTGGGATLPMVKKLAEGTVTAHGKTISVAAAKSFPEWLRRDYSDLETPYPRIAVSLGGARRNIIRSMGVLKTTGFGGGNPVLGSYQTKGI